MSSDLYKPRNKIYQILVKDEKSQCSMKNSKKKV